MHNWLRGDGRPCTWLSDHTYLI